MGRQPLGHRAAAEGRLLRLLPEPVEKHWPRLLLVMERA
jgi:hypothetical protein